MKIKSFLAIAMAAMTMTFVACKNDGTDKIDPENQPTGNETCAVFEFAVSESGSTRAVTPAAGDEIAIQKESRLVNASIYIFKKTAEDKGVAEVHKTGLTVDNTTGHIPAQAF